MLNDLLIEKVSKLKYLPEVDKCLLIDGLNKGYGFAQDLLPHLSIFAKKYTSRNIDGYSYLKYDSEPYFYLNYFKKLGVYVDGTKKILFRSRFYFSHLNSFIDNIDNCLF
jgi:hypothetical protein